MTAFRLLASAIVFRAASWSFQKSESAALLSSAISCSLRWGTSKIPPHLFKVLANIFQLRFYIFLHVNLQMDLCKDYADKSGNCKSLFSHAPRLRPLNLRPPGVTRALQATTLIVEQENLLHTPAIVTRPTGGFGH